MNDFNVPGEWRPIPGYESTYLVSSQGKVYSVRAGRTLKPYVLEGGYHQFALRGGATNSRSVKIHRIVAEVFLADSWFEGAVVRHLDGDGGHNDVSNLAWGTAVENMADRIEHGANPFVEQTECKWGHPFDEANTQWVITARGTRCRSCRKCKSDRARKYNHDPAKREHLAELRRAARKPRTPEQKAAKNAAAREARRDNGKVRQQDKTHCPQGHPYNEENTYRRSDGGRQCRACRAEREKRFPRKRVLTPEQKARKADYQRRTRGKGGQ